MWVVFMCALRALVTTDEGKLVLTQLESYMNEQSADLKYYQGRVEELITENGADFRACEEAKEKLVDKINDLQTEVERLRQVIAGPWEIIKGYNTIIYRLTSEEERELLYGKEKIWVIKAVCGRTGCPLREAVDSVDYFRVSTGGTIKSGRFERDIDDKIVYNTFNY